MEEEKNRKAGLEEENGKDIYLCRKVDHISKNHVHDMELSKFKYVLKEYTCLDKSIAVKEGISAELGTGQQVWDCVILLQSFANPENDYNKVFSTGQILGENP